MYALDPAIGYAVPVTNSPVTRGEEVYDVLRAELLNGVLNPGDKLRMVELALRFSVSQSVVREGLTRLAEQGLVVATPQRGFRVRELSVEDVVGLTESRVEIESVALRLAIERGDVRWETEIVAAHHLLERTPVVDDDGNYREEWGVRHRDFHQALTVGCNNARLYGVVLGLRDSAELYRRWWWAMADTGQRDLAAEHRQLKDLILARDADGAIEALTSHIRRAPDQLIAYAHEHGLDDLNTPPPRDSSRKQRRGGRARRK
jgi:DNA-binding GntR family transcriptional regulator